MSIHKAEIKQLILKDLGIQCRAQLRGAEDEIRRIDGAVGALKQAVEKLEHHKSYYQRDVDEKKLTMVEAKLVMQTIDRCEGILRNLAVAAEGQKLIQRGEVQVLERQLRGYEQAVTDEALKAEAILNAIENGELIQERPIARVVGQHPGDSIAARRKKAAKKRKPVKKGKSKRATNT